MLKQEVLGSDDLLIFSSPLERSVEKCCVGDNYLSCHEVDLNFKDFDQMKKSIKINGISLNFVRQVPPTGIVYKNQQGDEAVFSYNKMKKHLFGNINTYEGREFEIESCHNSHVIKEINLENLGSKTPLTMPNISNPESSAANRREDIDRSTEVTFSLKVYYTQEFEAVTADIELFVDQMISRTNLGFINSKIPVRVEAFCIEKATLSDAKGSDIYKFRIMKGSAVATLNTADAATLLVRDAPYCGVVTHATPAERDWAFSVNKKGCIADYVLGHELGHNFGCYHDKKSYSNSPDVKNTMYPYGYGHHIEKGSQSKGALTIMAYYKRGYTMGHPGRGRARVNYYSNPSVIYPLTGTPTGVAGAANNAYVITQNRFKMAAHGDESATCPGFIFTQLSSPSPSPKSQIQVQNPGPKSKSQIQVPNPKSKVKRTSMTFYD